MTVLAVARACGTLIRFTGCPQHPRRPRRAGRWPGRRRTAPTSPRPRPARRWLRSGTAQAPDATSGGPGFRPASVGPHQPGHADRDAPTRTSRPPRRSPGQSSAPEPPSSPSLSLSAATCPADCDGGTTLPEQPRGHVLRWDRLGDLIREYARSHRVTQFSAPRSTGPGQSPDHQAETRKLQATFTAMTLHMAADPGVRAAACEYARVWAGADLAERLRGPSRVLAGDPVGEAALLAAAVALTRRQPT